MRTNARLLAIPLLLLLAVANLTAACGASGREKTIQTTLLAVNAASDAFVRFDQDKRTEIVTKATSHEQGVALLNEWDGTVAKVQLAIGAAYKAIATAATLNDDHSLAGMVSAALILKTELDTLGVIGGGK
jgi:hypothetical protein